jgi:hypothetical protein
MQSLAEIVASRAGAIIAKSDNILADLQNLNITNEAVYKLMNGANTWFVRMYIDIGSSIDDTIIACIKAKTREEAIRKFLRIANAGSILKNVIQVKNLTDETHGHIYNTFYEIMNDKFPDIDDYSSDHLNYKICEKLYRDLINKHEEYILDLITKNEDDMKLKCEMLEFDKILESPN